MTGAPPILEARAVSCRFPVEGGGASVALDRVSLTVPRGAFACVTGPSGSGKTTLLAVLGLLERPTEGEVLVDGRTASGISDAERARRRREIGFVFQASPMLRGAPVWENVTAARVPLGVPASARRREAATALARVGLEALLYARPERLSGGERQRVGVARAIVSSPALLVADEPTSNLDEESGESVGALLAALHASGTTIVVATHDPRLLARAQATFALRRGALA